MSSDNASYKYYFKMRMVAKGEADILMLLSCTFSIILFSVECDMLEEEQSELEKSCRL